MADGKVANDLGKMIENHLKPKAKSHRKWQNSEVGISNMKN